ncbi:MAG: translation initiation inhibitor [Armatimonadetes bacterium]|nr:translation initiation inhibitor [Armatimonadota bacterium]
MAEHAAAPSQQLYTVTRNRQEFDELFLTLSGPDCTDISDLVDKAGGARIVRADVFGPPTPGWEEPDFPVTWVCNEHPDGADLSGVYVHAVQGAETRPLLVDGRVVGTVVETPYATECTLAGIRSIHTHKSRPEQARETFENIEKALAQVDMDFSNVVRTWLFLDQILEWYGEFNGVRTRFFNERDVFSKLVPASTGIGGANPAGSAMIASAFAMKPKSDQVCIQAVPSPLQCPALAYGSSFSRVVEVATPGCKRLLVSGTASIDRNGNTVYVGDVDGQVAKTFEVVQAILESRGMDWSHVTRATAYVRLTSDVGAYQRFVASRPDLAALPAIVANNIICRDDLLFELEVDAARCD